MGSGTRNYEKRVFFEMGIKKWWFLVSPQETQTSTATPNDTPFKKNSSVPASMLRVTPTVSPSRKRSPYDLTYCTNSCERLNFDAVAYHIRQRRSRMQPQPTRLHLATIVPHRLVREVAPAKQVAANIIRKRGAFHRYTNENVLGNTFVDVHLRDIGQQICFPSTCQENTQACINDGVSLHN